MDDKAISSVVIYYSVWQNKADRIEVHEEKPADPRNSV
jgi:hypothetical protein